MASNRAFNDFANSSSASAQGKHSGQLDRAHNRMPVSLENSFAATTIPNRCATQAVESLDYQFKRMKAPAPESALKFRIQP